MDNKLCFRAFEYEDLDFINELRNDEENYFYTCGNKYYISSVRDQKWIEDKIFNNNNQLYLMLCIKGEGTPVGYIAIVNIDYLNRKAQYGGIVISRQYSGKGIGTEATKLLLHHVFEELGMNMFYGYWREDHKASLKMAEKSGFKVDGLVRDYVFKQGKFHNAYILSMLKTEYEKLND